MKRLLTFIIAAIIFFPCGAQSWEEIKSSRQYIYGEGWGSSDAEADKNALADLISKISVQVQSSFTLTEDELSHNGQVDGETYARSKVQTYSQATLTNTEKIVIEYEPDAHVGRYILKSEISRIFEARRRRIDEMLGLAETAEKNAKIDDALRYYYWAYAMLKTLQHPNEVRDSNNHLLSTWIPAQMNDIFDGIKVRPMRKTSDNVLEVAVTYKGKPVASYDYTYFDGLQWSAIYSGKDGIGTIELRPNSALQNINMKYEYEYADEAHIDKEIASVMQMFRGTAFRKASTTVNAAGAKAMAATPGAMNANTNATASASSDIRKEFEQMVNNESDIKAEKASDDQQMAEIMGKVIASLKSRDTKSIQPFFTTDGWDMYLKLLHYGKAKVIGNPQYSFYKMGEDVICRSVPMSFSFNNNRRKFVESVTFTFNKEKKIDAVAFGLGNVAKTDIFNRGAMANWSEESRMILANFLENYKTAFALKRLDYIESIFDDNAVIITGHVVKKAEKSLENGKYIQNEHVRYNRVSKADYIKNLRMCFDSNEFINIKFTDNDIMKMGQGGELYGIQIHQDYYSSSYGDTGYLFLLVDINNPKEPTIYVRTWQPERDPNVNNRLPKDHPDYGIYGSGNF